MQLSPHKSYCKHDGLTRLHTCRYTFLLVRVSPYLRESEQFNVHHWEVITENRGSVTTTAFAQVIRQARSHDEEALVALYHRALPVIYRYALARLGRSDLVEDVVSEVFLVMVESIGELRTEQEAGFYAWLLQIAQGKISKALRHVTRSERKYIPLPGAYLTNDFPTVELMATDLVSNPVALHEWRETLEEVGIAL